MTTKVPAGVYYDHPGWYRLVCRYDPWMQDDLKKSVGFGNYKWDPDVKYGMLENLLEEKLLMYSKDMVMK